MKNNVKLFLILLSCLCLCMPVGCNHETTGDQTTNTTKANETSTVKTTTETSGTTVPSSVEPSDPDLKLQLIVVGDQLVLIPAMLEDYTNALAKGEEDLIWRYVENTQTWESISWDVQKCQSVTGQFYNDEQTSTFDIYRMQIGDFVGFHLRNKEAASDEMARRLLEDLITGVPIFQSRSKDFTILQIFEDLYAIDKDGNLRMISGRKIDIYNYDTIQKKGQGDLFRWYWTSQPTCCPQNNAIYYLSSREGLFYSIWQIDLDKNTEKRFGKDVAIELHGSSDSQLIAVMNPDNSEYYSKQISLSDPASFTPITERSWQSYSGRLFKNDGNMLFLEYPDVQIKVNASIAYQPMLLGESITWFSAQSKVNEISLIRLDLDKKMVSPKTTARMNTLTEWQAIMREIIGAEMTLMQAAEQGFKISID